jgi:peptidyl-prolyl cis-trans isomerase C
MNLKKHSNNNKIIIASLYLMLSLVGCSKAKKVEHEIVKVNDAALTKDELDSVLRAQEYSGKVREEYINDWIEKEILYQEAVKEGITEDKKYLSILDKSKKELAIALFMDKIIKEEKIDLSEEEIETYYNSHAEDFKTNDELYRLNIASFTEFDKAVQFREKVFNIGWNSTLLSVKNDPVVNITNSKLVYKSDLQPVTFLRIVINLQPPEVSTVLETEPGKYSVVQVIEKFAGNTLLPFFLAKEDVKQKLTILKQKEFVNRYIKKMISDHNIEVERNSE